MTFNRYVKKNNVIESRQKDELELISVDIEDVRVIDIDSIVAIDEFGIIKTLREIINNKEPLSDINFYKCKNN